MNQSQNLLKFICRICLLLPLLVGCKPHSYALLFIHNLTDKDLVVKANINTKEYVQFSVGADSVVNVADSGVYDYYIKEVPISEFVSNPDASVQVYVEEENELILVKEWKYSEKDDAGKQFFNELFLYRIDGSEPDGGEYYSYYFIITQDDIDQ